MKLNTIFDGVLYSSYWGNIKKKHMGRVMSMFFALFSVWFPFLLVSVIIALVLDAYVPLDIIKEITFKYTSRICGVIIFIIIFLYYIPTKRYKKVLSNHLEYNNRRTQIISIFYILSAFLWMIISFIILFTSPREL